MLAAALLEIGGQVLVRIAPRSAPGTQISLHRNASRRAWNVATS